MKLQDANYAPVIILISKIILWSMPDYLLPARFLNVPLTIL
ncbi:MAG TPA: hypothetical protein PLE33_06320 [Candidatus Cloacimonas sp.]|nr:hypothetical protein [Candidatus Cloacimonas sp.]HPS60862.1 hypothetical protein [Candidatus Cloacimonas sp.]